MNSIINILGGFRIIIGLLFLAFGCFLDFSLGGFGTCLRFISGLSGAYLILGHTRNGLGYVLGMIVGLIGYSWAIRSGSLSVFDMFYVEGFAKFATRIVCAFMFILGLKDVKEN